MILMIDKVSLPDGWNLLKLADQVDRRRTEFVQMGKEFVQHVRCYGRSSIIGERSDETNSVSIKAIVNDKQIMEINIFHVECSRRCLRGGVWQRQRHCIKECIQNRDVLPDEGICKSHPFLLLPKLDAACCGLQDFGDEDQVSSHRG